MNSGAQTGEVLACAASPNIFQPVNELKNGQDHPLTVRARELCLACTAFERCLERVTNGDFNFPVAVRGIIAATTTAERKAMFAEGKPRAKKLKSISHNQGDSLTVIMQPDVPAKATYARHNSKGGTALRY